MLVHRMRTCNAARALEMAAFGAPLRPTPRNKDGGQRYAACPMLLHRAAQRALPNGPQWRIKVVLSDPKGL